MPPPVVAGIFAVGATATAVGQYKAGKAAKRAADFNAQLEEAQGEFNASQRRAQVKALIGRQKALYAKGGVILSEGSAADVTRDTAIRGEREALMIKYMAEMGAESTRQQGRAAKESAKYGAIGTLITGGTQAYSIAKGGD